MNDIRQFSTRQAAKLSGLGYDVVDYWHHTGFLVPSVNPEGRYARRAYLFVDVLALKVAADLRSTGISLQSLRKVVDHLKARGTREPVLASVYLVSDGHDVFECRGDEIFSVLQQSGQSSFHFVIDLTRTETELREAVEKLKLAA